MSFRILAINPGSTSIKVGVYEYVDGEVSVHTGVLEHCTDAVAAIQSWLGASDRLDAVVGRGGLLPPLHSGTYRVNDAMLADLRAAKRGRHASNMGGIFAYAVAMKCGCPAFVVDPVSVDELAPQARFSGLAGIEREALSHALNSKAIAKRFAAEIGKHYEDLRLIVAHLGSGISVSAHAGGRMIDVNNSREEGPFSAERTGSLPVLAIVTRAIQQRWSVGDAERIIFREGGLYSYLGTKDLASMLDDERAQPVIAAMVYQIVKETGAMAAALDGEVDAILITGGMARSERLSGEIRQRIEWIAPVAVYAGEDELRALAEGALRVLEGKETAREYS